MRTTTVTDNLTQLTRLRFINAYLVREEDGFTLVDTGMPGAADDYIRAAATAGGAIKRIALTHGHGDHVGSLDALRAELGDDVPVLMPELDARIHAGEKVVEGKLAGQLAEAHDDPGRTTAAGRPRRQSRGRRRARATPPGTAPFWTRATAH